MKNLMPKLVLASLFMLAFGMLTSITLMAVFHILMIPAIIYYAPKYNWKKFPKSAWALLAFSLITILSVIVNQDIITNGYKSAFKVKYFIIGALSIIPLDFYFNEYLKGEEKIRVIRNLLYTFLIASTVATIAGIVGFFTGRNPLNWKIVNMERTSGMFGMSITYAHSVALLSTLLIVVFINRKRISQYRIPNWLLLSALLINCYGLFFSYARGALIAFLASLIFINKKIALYLISFIFIVSVGFSILRPEYFRNNIARTESNNQRITLWKSAISAFKERPLLGYGYQNFEPHSLELKNKYNIPGPMFKGHAHNNFLEILSTTGALGFLAMIIWIVLWITEVIQSDNLTKYLVLPFTKKNELPVCKYVRRSSLHE